MAGYGKYKNTKQRICKQCKGTGVSKALSKNLTINRYGCVIHANKPVEKCPRCGGRGYYD